MCIRILDQQRFHPVRVHHVLGRRPLEDREPPVLRGHERDRVALVVDELRG